MPDQSWHLHNSIRTIDVYCLLNVTPLLPKSKISSLNPASEQTLLFEDRFSPDKSHQLICTFVFELKFK